MLHVPGLLVHVSCWEPGADWGGVASMLLVAPCVLFFLVLLNELLNNKAIIKQRYSEAENVVSEKRTGSLIYFVKVKAI